MSAQVDGSGIGVKLRKMSVPLAETKNPPIPMLFVNEESLIVKSEALKPEMVVAERSVHW
jgi:hypothetical protein